MSSSSSRSQPTTSKYTEQYTEEQNEEQYSASHWRLPHVLLTCSNKSTCQPAFSSLPARDENTSSGRYIGEVSLSSARRPVRCSQQVCWQTLFISGFGRKLSHTCPVGSNDLLLWLIHVGVVFDDAQLFTSQLEGMKQIEELTIIDCNSLTSLPFSILPTTLKIIEISRCRKLKLEQPVGEMSMFLEELKLEGCDCIDDISPELFPRAGDLCVVSCHNLTRFLIPTSTETLSIQNCENVEKLSVACGGTQMTSLRIKGCKKLKWLPERMQELLPSLKVLDLRNCPEIEFFPEGGLPFNLQALGIRNCNKLVNGRKEWRLQRLPCLNLLGIKHDGSDEEIVGGENWELSSSIQRLFISNLKTLSSQVLKSLTSLQYLEIHGNLPQIQSMLEQGQFSHLTSLQRLQIIDFPNLQSLPESALPSSLSQLTISNCPKLQSLPLKEMPSSLSNLEIYDCPLLKPLLEFNKGKYWPNIAQIPVIFINGKCIDEVSMRVPNRFPSLAPSSVINQRNREINSFKMIILSGTLGYVMSEVEDGKPFSQVINAAKSLVYTEPEVECIYRRYHTITVHSASKLSLIFVDNPFQEKAPSPKDANHCILVNMTWRILKLIHNFSWKGNIRYEVGIQEVPKDSALGRLRGSDDVVEIYSRCYEKQPLVIQGAGAGNDTTAAGVLADIPDIQDLFP
uniref:Disease resistance protein I2, putative n=1 Tax=Solanum demissum TaxID=50514 RepID=Q60D56_SOLDE|nr:Disease resistance protein I2, putative [Solanum demissum]